MSCNTIGPLPDTVVDFWRMVWQERSSAIVMLANCEEGGRAKCEQYWPESGQKSFGPFVVYVSDKQIFADYTVRKLEVSVSLLLIHLITYTFAYNMACGRAQMESLLA